MGAHETFKQDVKHSLRESEGTAYELESASNRKTFSSCVPLEDKALRSDSENDPFQETEREKRHKHIHQRNIIPSVHVVFCARYDYLYSKT